MNVLASMTNGNSGEIRLIDAFQILLEKIYLSTEKSYKENGLIPAINLTFSKLQ